MSNYYQIIDTTPLWVEVEKTTLETCTDVAYSEEDLWELYNGGNEFVHSILVNKTDVTLYQNRILFVERIVTTIVTKMKDVKEVTNDILPEVFVQTGFFDQIVGMLREEGVSYSPKRNKFIKYKPSKKKVLYDGQALRRGRILLINAVISHINLKFGAQMEQAGNRGKPAEEGVVRLGKFLGFTFDDINTGEFIQGTYWSKLSPEVEVHTYEALRAWFDSVGPDVPVVKNPKI